MAPPGELTYNTLDMRSASVR